MAFSSTPKILDISEITSAIQRQERTSLLQGTEEHDAESIHRQSIRPALLTLPRDSDVPQNNDDQGGPITPLAIGKALHLLLNANDRAFELAVETAKKFRTENRATDFVPLAVALCSIEDFIEQAVSDETNDSQAKASVQTEAMGQLYAPLKEKILKRTTTIDQPTTVFRLLRYFLLRSPHRAVFVVLLQRELKSKDKRAKLAVVMLLEHVVSGEEDGKKNKRKGDEAKNGEKNRKMAVVEEFKKGNDGERNVDGESRVIGLTCDDIVKFMPSLVECVQVDSTLSFTGQRTPTKLTNLASDVALSLSRGLARTTMAQAVARLPKGDTRGETGRKALLIVDLSEEDNPVAQLGTLIWAVWQIIPDLGRLLGELGEWYRGVHPTMEAALREVKELIRRVELHAEGAGGTPDKDVLNMLCHDWIEFAGALVSSNTALSPPADISPTNASCSLITIALLLGHRDAKLSLAKLLGHKKGAESGGVPEPEKRDLVAKMTELVSTVIHSPHHPTSAHPLAFHLFRRLLVDDSSPADVASRRDQMRAFLEPLMGMLEEEGEADEDEKADRNALMAEGVAGLVAGYAREFPDEILEPVFRMMDSASAGRRRRAIRVVDEVVRANDGMFDGNEEGVGMERLRNSLEHHLLARLHDDDIHLRKATSRLFANLDTAHIVPKLAARLTDPDARVRSAAEAALVETLLRSRWGLDAVVAFVEYIRNFQANPHHHQLELLRDNTSPSKNINDTRHTNPGSITDKLLAGNTGSSVPRSPADIVSGNQSSGNLAELDGINETETFNHTSIASSALLANGPNWYYPPSTIDPLLTAPHLIISNIIYRLTITDSSTNMATPCADARHQDLCLAFRSDADTVLDHYRAVLTEELLDAKSDDSALAVQSLLFARLCPLLILKTFPSEAYDAILTITTDQVLAVDDYWDEQESDSAELMKRGMAERMSRALVLRSDHPVEFPQIRQLSLSLFPKLFFLTSLPLICRKLIKTHAQNLVILKGWMFAFCSWVLEMEQRESAGVVVEETDVQWIAKTVNEAVLVILTWKGPGGEELHKLQLGAIDSLSLILTVTAPKALASMNTMSSTSTPSARSPQRPLIEELDANPTPPTPRTQNTISHLYFSLLTHVLSTLHPPSTINISSTLFSYSLPTPPDPQLSIVMANVLVMTVKRLGGQPLGGSGAPEQPKVAMGSEVRSLTEKEMNLFGKFVEGVGLRVIDVANRVVRQEGEGGFKEAGGAAWGNLAAACLQVLFHIVYTFRADPSRVSASFFEDMLDTSINSINSANIQTQIGSLKLLTTLLSLTNTVALETSGINEAVTNVLTPSKIARIRGGLEGLQRAPSAVVSREISVLAERILMTLDGVIVSNITFRKYNYNST
ncbi:hypothetical protein BC937DRAFT_92942 [Endogone sp. FLAS-F59071]|nr:hypothetical protein BC937DRAFT_92942 [Endogone sp. FLAS-F59071]|eukprot:RUS21353.1 hypothetical protein BC937DRAFT_92942 [Endogone sp. FLAS-F59071]